MNFVKKKAYREHRPISQSRIGPDERRGCLQLGRVVVQSLVEYPQAKTEECGDCGCKHHQISDGFQKGGPVAPATFTGAFIVKEVVLFGFHAGQLGLVVGCEGGLVAGVRGGRLHQCFEKRHSF